MLLRVLPTAERLLELTPPELDHLLLRHIAAATDNPTQRMVTRDGIVTELFRPGGGYDMGKRDPIRRAIAASWKRLEEAGLIEEPDPHNGSNGFRIVSSEGRSIDTTVDLEAAKVRGWLPPERLHKALRGPAWRAFSVGDYDTAVFEAFKAVEIAVRNKSKFPATDYGQSLMKKAFDPTSGPLTDKAATQGRRKARRNLFAGALGELRNPKAHSDPTITDPLVAIEELMVASALLRIVG